MSTGWAKVQGAFAGGQGFMSKIKKRKNPLKVSGGGHGHQVCDHDGVVPVCLRDDEQKRALGTFEAPLIEGDMPALMGRVSLQNARTIIDTSTNEIYMMGPGDHLPALKAAMPPGTRCFQTEIAPSGHMMLPCASYGSGSHYKDEQVLKLQPELTLPIEMNPE